MEALFAIRMGCIVSSFDGNIIPYVTKQGNFSHSYLTRSSAKIGSQYRPLLSRTQCLKQFKAFYTINIIILIIRITVSSSFLMDDSSLSIQSNLLTQSNFSKYCSSYLDGWTKHLVVSFLKRPKTSKGNSGFFINTFQILPDMFRHIVAILRVSWVPYKLLERYCM
jgi:hypothetical protein